MFGRLIRKAVVTKSMVYGYENLVVTFSGVLLSGGFLKVSHTCWTCWTVS